MIVVMVDDELAEIFFHSRRPILSIVVIRINETAPYLVQCELHLYKLKNIMGLSLGPQWQEIGSGWRSD